MTTSIRRTRHLAPALGLLAAEGDPEEVLASARAELDATEGAHVTVACDDLPEGVSGLLGADGTVTDAPAFDGTVQLRYGGLTGDIPVISVGGTVYAKLPFTTDFAPIDPAEYGAPDPALLVTPGISQWLATAADVTEGDSVRDGHEVLTPYSGSLSGEVVAAVIPGADDEATFDVTFTITEDGLLHEAEVSGPFYEGEDEVTYVVGIDDYGTQPAVRAP
jgi:lipoprotein LprG